MQICEVELTIAVKNVLNVFFIFATFLTFLNVFVFFQRFFYFEKKRALECLSRTLRSTFGTTKTNQ